MISVGFIILFGLTFVLFPCKGKIIPPPDGTELVFLNGSNANITWSFDDDISAALSRAWYFTSSDGSFNARRLAIIVFDQEPQIEKSGLSGVTIVKPATLILENVNQTYNGTYRFALAAGSNADSFVDVFIATAPNVTINRTSPIMINEGDNFICGCRGEGGNPPADVTWYDKDGVQIGETGKEKQPLNLINVNETNNRTYKCVGQSHISATDEESIKVIVKLNFKPKNTTLTPNKAVVGTLVVITCNSEGLPEPSYRITLRNGTVVSIDKTYTIAELKLNDTGTCAYKCIALNKLGNDSACSNLTVEPRPATTIPSSTKSSGKSSGKQPSTPTTTGGKTTTTKAPRGPCPVVPCIIPILCAFLVVLVIILCLVYRYKKKEKDGYRSSCFSGNADVSPDGSGGVAVNHYELDGEPGGEVDNTYDTANPSGASGSKSKPPQNTLPPVYAAVDKSKKDGKPLYATLDTIALHSDNSKKKRDEERPGQSEYASIDFGKIGKADQE